MSAEKRYVDLAIIVPLEEEAEVLFQVFKATSSEAHENIMFTTVQIPGSDLSAIVAQCSNAGCNDARIACEVAFRHFNVGMVACVGIAGRITSDLLLGDVCYTGVVLDVSERQKIVDVPGTKGVGFLFSPETYSTTFNLQASVTFSRTDQTLKRVHFETWQAECGERLERVLGTLDPDSKAKTQFRDFPVCQHGKIACGPVSASKNFIQSLLDHDRKILAIETEAGGIFKACVSHHNVPAIAIRGISDFADDKKNKLEGEMKGVARQTAAYNAASFLKLQFSNPYFLEFLSVRKRELTGVGVVPTLFDDGRDRKNALAAVLIIINAKADAALRELSPEYRLQPKGYVLPSPRLARMHVQGDPRTDEDVENYEVQDALAANNVVLVDTPLNYPDEGLPWVIANSLAAGVVDGRLVVPCVLDGTKISAPTDLEKMAPELDLAALAVKDDAQVVFVIHNFDLRSRSRTSFLLRQFEKYPRAKFLFVTRGEGNLVFTLESVQRMGAQPYRIDGVPFLAIANFILANFHFEPIQAEVIAYRIQNAFERFDLIAHPSYFAQIPEETLLALLQANRRSELIQLAVDGFLTFLVAEDKSIPLSRTTRRRFLSELAVEIEVYKRTFSRQELTEFGDAFFARYDFEGDVGLFTERFFQKGILRIEDGTVRFSLPFIKKYLLAVALAKDAKIAKQHFAFGAEDFDVETFDLYAELGPDDTIIDELLMRLQGNLGELERSNSRPGVMLTGELKPALLERPGQIATLRNAVQQSLKALTIHGKDGKRKQRFIDVANKAVRETGQAKADELQKAKPETQDLISRSRRDWQVGCVLLGAAAEQLVATRKQQLIPLLVQTASRLIDAQTRAAAAVDYSVVKERNLTSEETVEFLSGFSTDDEREQFKKLAGNILDLMELAVLAQPFVSTVGFLAEQARHQILGASIEKSNVEGLQDVLIRNAWLADLDASRGKRPLKIAVAELPAAPFFRLVLATHLHKRIYWAQWREEDRLALLETAQDVVAPLGLQFKGDVETKRELKWIGRNKDKKKE